MPCINSNKRDIAEIARRFPEHVERIAQWERLVAAVCRRMGASFFHASTQNGTNESRGIDIRSVVEWSKTKHGGRLHDESWDAEAPACSSSYGLCE